MVGIAVLLFYFARLHPRRPARRPVDGPNRSVSSRSTVLTRLYVLGFSYAPPKCSASSGGESELQCSHGE